MSQIRNASDTTCKQLLRDGECFADLCNALYFHGRQVIKPENLISQENDVSTLIGKERITNGNEKISRYRQKSKYQWRVYDHWCRASKYFG